MVGKQYGYTEGYNKGWEDGEKYGRFNSDGLGQLTMLGRVETFLKEHRESLESSNYKREIGPRGHYD